MITAADLAQILGIPAPTDEQTAVIEAPLAPALVVAGAGSGKTETMAARVLYLVANQLVHPEQILGLTFTRKAAAGLAARIRRRLRALAVTGMLAPTKGAGVSPLPDEVPVGEPEVWTYHAFGGRIISEFGPLVGVEPGARVLSATAAWQLARRVVARWDGDLDTDLRPEQVTEQLLALAGGLADHLSDQHQLADEIDSVLGRIRDAAPGSRQKGPVRTDLVDHLRRLSDRRAILPLVAAFGEAKRAAGALDFADQMQLAATLADQVPQVGETLRHRHRVVLLDEYQDTGHAQRVILRALFGAPDEARTESGRRGPTGHPVTAVGDPVQSIYSWRGASASNLPRFGTDFPRADGRPATTLNLSTSFRNADSVLEVANRVSAPVRAGAVAVQSLRSRPGAPAGEVRAALFETIEDEDRWVAGGIRARWDAAAAAGRPAPSTAVLVRRRRDMEDMAGALRAAGLPVEVVGLGGLLAEPEIADLVAVLRVLVDPGAGDAALRLLTGARWRLGVADLDVLARRAAALSRRPGGGGTGSDRPAGREAVRQAIAQAATSEDVDTASLIDAISDPGPAEHYSVNGFRRLGQFSDELHRLRRRLGQPLTDLIADIERTTGLDIEVAVHSPAGRAHLDAFADVVADVAAAGAGPAELIDYLLTADQREDGLKPGDVEPTPGRVQILTVHAAKGLEWQIVAVPQLSRTVFPSERSRSWLSDPTQLPPAVRGDRADLPRLDLPAGGDQKEVSDAIKRHVAELKEAGQVEERRLLYVAVTRAEETLLLSAHHWGRTGASPLGPSEFFIEMVTDAPAPAGLVIDHWAPAPSAGEPNPLTAVPRRASWPADPLAERRGAAEAGAAAVLAALADGSAAGLDGDPFRWERDVAALLAERVGSASRALDVTLPPALSVSALVEMADDPARLARRLRRPVPLAPTPQARRGTAFHAWLERHFRGEPLLDITDLPGASDAGAAGDEDLESLRTAFLASEWAGRVPVQVEMPFSTTIAGMPVRGRIDAVFADADGGFTVVDWKTGSPPRAGREAAAAVQLAVYRLAAAELLGVPAAQVRAAFAYLAVGSTVAPVDLLDPAGLERLLRQATGDQDAPEEGPEPPPGPWVSAGMARSTA